jgi:hypothetical protein
VKSSFSTRIAVKRSAGRPRTSETSPRLDPKIVPAAMPGVPSAMAIIVINNSGSPVL